jgi:hypothetical protein
LSRGIEFQRTTVSDINEVLQDFPDVKAVFNCTGLGSYHLKGVEDKSLYPTRVRFPSDLPSSQLNVAGPSYPGREPSNPDGTDVLPLPSKGEQRHHLRLSP